MLNIKNWQQLVEDVTPKQTGCGPVYELPNPIERPNENFAIADMRTIHFAEPHYHVETEIYFVLQGNGLIVIGGKEQEISKGTVVTIPSNIAHFTIPKENLVLAVINTPPFKQENYIVLQASNKKVGFDKDQLDMLLKHNN